MTQMWVLLGESTGVKTPFCPHTCVCVCVFIKTASGTSTFLSAIFRACSTSLMKSAAVGALGLVLFFCASPVPGQLWCSPWRWKR